MRILRELQHNKYLYLLAVPGLIFLLIFAYVPMFGHLIAFKKFNISKGIWGSDWVGFDNFKFFFGGDWLHITINTLYLNAMFIVCGLGTSLMLAICLNEIRLAVLKRICQSFVFMPYFISWLVVSFMTYAMFNTTGGLINKLLMRGGFEKVSWFSLAEVWPFILTGLFVWKTAGYFSIIFLAAITSISSEYYESAKIDGATRIQQIVHITLPLLRPTLIVLLLLQIGRIFYGDFGMIYGIVGDNPILIQTTDVIDTYAYRALRQIGNFSLSGAVVLYQALMGLVTIVIFNWMIRRIDKDSSLF